MKIHTARIIVTMLLVFSFFGFSFAQVNIRIMADISDGALPIFEDIISRFEAANPDIVVTFDNVPYSTILESLPLQLEAGTGPDIAKVTNTAGLAEFYLDMRPYLTDAAYWDANFASTISLMNPDGGNRISGFFQDVTVTGPFINRTLFEQAGVAVPSDSSDKVTWEEWADAARAVAKALDIPYAMAMDRSGHRFAGPAISQGAKYFDADGVPSIKDDAGIRKMAELMLEWHADGTMPLDVWAGGDSYRDARQEFINAQLVFYMSGNWQIGGFTDAIGDAFDWEAVPNPCGPGTCTGMPGGSTFVAIGKTRHPAEVTRFMEFFASEEIYREWAERTLFIPQHDGLVNAGLNFNTDLPQAQQALNSFAKQASQIDALGFALLSYPHNNLVFNTMRDRLTQALVGELSLDEALERVQQDINLGLSGTSN